MITICIFYFDKSVVINENKKDINDALAVRSQ